VHLDREPLLPLYSLQGHIIGVQASRDPDEDLCWSQ